MLILNDKTQRFWQKCPERPLQRSRQNAVSISRCHHCPPTRRRRRSDYAQPHRRQLKKSHQIPRSETTLIAKQLQCVYDPQNAQIDARSHEGCCANHQFGPSPKPANKLAMGCVDRVRRTISKCSGDAAGAHHPSGRSPSDATTNGPRASK